MYLELHFKFAIMLVLQTARVTLKLRKLVALVSVNNG